MSSIKIDVGPATTGARTLSIQRMQDREIGLNFVEQFKDTWHDRASTFMLKGGTASETLTAGALSYRVIRHVSVPAGDYQRLRGILTTAMSCLDQCPSLCLRDYPVEILVDTARGSAGYVIQDKLLGQRKVSVFLGIDIWGTQPTNTGIIANYLYRYLRCSEAEKIRLRTLTAVFHEFGHVFHQLLSPSHYFALAVLPILSGKGEKEMREPRNRPMWRLFDMCPSVAYLRDFHRGLQRYLSAHVSSYASDRPLETVAEIFSGLMMGIRFTPDVLTVYRAFGGHVPEDGMRYETTDVATAEALRQGR